MFYSARSQIKINGNATNWNGTGFEEIYDPPGKFSVKLLQKVSRCHKDDVMINDHISFNINTRTCGTCRRFLNFIGPLK